MGTLDDAIREHLELKKRLGASEDEIKEKETEAFGKGARPAPAEPEPAPEPREPESAGEGEPFIEHDLAAADPAPNGKPQGPAGYEMFEPDEVPAEESLDPELRVRDERRPEPELEPEAEPEAEPEPAPWAEDEPPQATEDVLEETPEFLEETPESDRLWFEQRPPKDFDFD